MSTAKSDLDLPADGAASASLASALAGRRKKDTSALKIKRHDLAFILRNLATLVGHGLALPKALATLARERSVRKYADMLQTLKRKVEIGETFSSALGGFPATFTDVMVNQVRAGERAGMIGSSLSRIADQVEKANRVRSQVIRKLAYPMVLIVAGSLAVAFMLVFVIPVFDEIYAEAHVPLPAVTRTLMTAGELAVGYGWIVLLAGIGSVVFIKRARRQEDFATAMDRFLLRLPLLGDWFRNLAVLQFMDVFGDMIQSGFKVIDALDISARSIGNRAVRQSVRDVQAAVNRDERFGRELDQLGDLFPPVVSQLIAVGEQTGSLAEATAEIRRHLEQEIERHTNVMVGTIEPILTISLAAAIAVILLAIYLPMFDMMSAVGNG